MKYIIARDGGVFLHLHDDVYQRYSDEYICELKNEEIIRDICSQKDIEELLTKIEFIRTIKANRQKLFQEFYEEEMNKYDEESWVKVIKSEYIRDKLKQAYPFEKVLALRAKEYLYSEISILMNISYKDVEKYIVDYIRENSWDE